VAWWSVRWWLSPRPLYTLWFPEFGDITDDGGKPSEQPSTQGAPTLGRHRFEVAPFDREGRLIVIQRPHVPESGRVTLELISIADGATLAAHHWSATEAAALALFYLPPFTFGGGENNGLSNGVLYAPWHSPIGSTHYLPCLREYDLVAGRVRDVLIPPAGTEMKVCRD